MVGKIISIHIYPQKDEKGVLQKPVCIKYPDRKHVMRFDEAIIHGPCRLVQRDGNKRLLLETEAEVEGINYES